MTPGRGFSSNDTRKIWRYEVETEFRSIADPSQKVDKHIIGYATAERFIPFDRPIAQSYYNLASSVDGRLLAIPDGNNIDVYSLDTGSRTVLKGHTSKVRTLGFSPVDSTLLVSSAEKYGEKDEKDMIIIWDVAKQMGEAGEQEPLDIDRAAKKGVQAVINDTQGKLELSQEDTAEMTSSLKLMIERCHTRNRIPAASRLHGRISTSFQSPLFSNGGKYLIYLPDSRPQSNNDDTWDIKLYHLGTRVSTTLTGHRDAIMWIGFSPDDSLVASAGWDGSFRVHKVTGQEVWRWETDKQNWAAVWSPDGNYLAGTDGAGIIRIWDVRTGVETAQHENGQCWCRAIDWSPNGKYIAVGTEDQGRIALYEFADGKITLAQERKLSLERCRFEPANSPLRGFMYRLLTVHVARFLSSNSGSMRLVHAVAMDEGIEVTDFETGRGWRFVPPYADSGEAILAKAGDGQNATVSYLWRTDQGEIGIVAPDGVRFWHLD